MSASNDDALESARILIQENLFEEAKRVLFRLIAQAADPHSSSVRRAQELLKKIEQIEINELVSKPCRQGAKSPVEDSKQVISALERDLQLEEDNFAALPADHEWWNVEAGPSTARELFDLAVAFYEMGCFADALRELRRAEKKVRIENTFLGELGVSIVALSAQSLISLGQAFDAKIYLEPVLLESDIPHEQKTILYYVMGLADEALGEKASARGWFNKVIESDPDFKDARQKVRLLAKQLPRTP